MSKLFEKNITERNSFLHKIIEESSKTDGKNILTMINDLSKSIVKDIDNLKLIIKKPSLNEIFTEASDKQENKNKNIYFKKNFMTERTNVNLNILNERNISKNRNDDNNKFKNANLNIKKINTNLNKKSTQEFEILITEDSNGKATNNTTGNVIDSTENSIIITPTNLNSGNVINSILFVNDNFTKHSNKNLSISNFNFNININFNSSIERNNENLNLVKKHNTNLDSFDYEKLYREKCDDLEQIETKFEEISDKFYFMLDRCHSYQNNLIEDNQSLKEIIKFILQCYSEKQFDSLNYIIQYLKENETFMGKVNFVGVTNLVNYLSNTNNDNYYENSGLNSNNCNSNVENENKSSIKSMTATKTKSSKDLYSPNHTKQLNFSDIKFINTEENISNKKRSISKTSTKDLIGVKKNLSYANNMKPNFNLTGNITGNTYSPRILSKEKDTNYNNYGNLNLNNSKIIMNNTIIGFPNYSKENDKILNKKLKDLMITKMNELYEK